MINFSFIKILTYNTSLQSNVQIEMKLSICFKLLYTQYFLYQCSEKKFKSSSKFTICKVSISNKCYRLLQRSFLIA